MDMFEFLRGFFRYPNNRYNDERYKSHNICTINFQLRNDAIFFTIEEPRVIVFGIQSGITMTMTLMMNCIPIQEMG